MKIPPNEQCISKLVSIEVTPVDFFGCLKNIINIQKDIINPIDIFWEANV